MVTLALSVTVCFPASAAEDVAVVFVQRSWLAFTECAVEDLVQVRGYPTASVKVGKDKFEGRAAIEVRDLNGNPAFSLAISGTAKAEAVVMIRSMRTAEAIQDWQARAQETVQACGASP